MKTEATDRPTGGDMAPSVSPKAPVTQADKPARGDWAVAVTPEQPAAHKPLSTHAPAVIHKRPAAAHEPSAGQAPSDAAHSPESRAARLDKIMAPPPSGHKLAPIALGLVLALAIGAGVAAHLSKKKAAEQRAVQTLATVTGFLSRVEDLKKRVPPYQQQLDGPIGDLQSLVAASAPGADDSQRINRAIAIVAAVEGAVFGAETDAEQAKQALESLAQHPDYPALSEKMRVAIADQQGLQKAVEAKCQKVRAMIIAANASVARRGRVQK